MACSSCNPQSFWNEARFQSTCGLCGKARRFHAHHVVDRQTLRRVAGLSGDDLYDPRNAMRLCQEIGNPKIRCHFQHENAVEGQKVPTRKLSDTHVEYAFEKLGDWALDYLRRDYDDSDPDPRLIAREEAMAA